jgi:hypothetical protein
VNFNVSMAEFDQEIGALRDKGVTFLTFEAEGLNWADGIASMGEAMKAVWFADPDGNILNVTAAEM